ncbi:MAG: glycosyltransferase [Mycobacteriales bacterium]
MPVGDRPLFVSWIPGHGRSSALAREIGADALFVGTATQAPGTAVLRYLRNAWATWRALASARPSAIVVMLPPLPAALTVVAWARRRRARVVLDAHTGVFNDPKWRWLLWPTLALAKRATATIVTNEALAAVVRARGGRALVLHNPPDLAAAAIRARGGGGVVVVCGWANDEPVDAVLAAVADIETPVTLTGRPPAGLPSRHPRVRFSGWLDDDDYTSLIAAADVIVALTTRPHTMQQAGYEALALHVPLVTSDTAVLREFFQEGAAFTSTEPSAIAEAIRTALRNGDQLREGMRRLHARRAAGWRIEIDELRRLVGSPREGARQ